MCQTRSGTGDKKKEPEMSVFLGLLWKKYSKSLHEELQRSSQNRLSKILSLSKIAKIFDSTYTFSSFLIFFILLVKMDFSLYIDGKCQDIISGRECHHEFS